MTIRKFDAKGRIVEFEDDRVEMPGGGTAQSPLLSGLSVQKYVGEWTPGIDHPKTTITDKDGQPITLFLPIPEEQIVRE